MGRQKTKKRILRKKRNTKKGGYTSRNQPELVNLTNINETTVIPEHIKNKFHEYLQKFMDEMEYESVRTGETRLLMSYFQDVKDWLFNILNGYIRFKEINTEQKLIYESETEFIMSNSRRISWDNIVTSLLVLYKYMYENRQYKNNFRDELFPPT